MSKKALITEEFHPLLKEGLLSMGYETVELWDIDTMGVVNIIYEYNLLVINSKILIDKTLLTQAKKLEAIIRIGSGLEVVDMEACKARNIAIISTPEGNANAVAEHTLGFILSAYNNMYRAQSQLNQGIWNREYNRGEELCGKTISIIGCGNNGSRLVKLLSGFNTDVLVYDIVNVRTRIQNPNATQVEMDEIYEKADIVSFHIPLNPSTKNLINEEYIGKFKKKVDLVNTSRGGICDYNAIWSALKNGKIRRLMLDVFDKEPFIMNNEFGKYIEQGKLFATPHIAGWTQESKRRMAEIALQKLKKASFS